MPRAPAAYPVLEGVSPEDLADHLLALRGDLFRLLSAIGHPSALRGNHELTNLDDIEATARKFAGRTDADTARRVQGTANSIFSDRCLDVLTELDTTAGDVQCRLEGIDSLDDPEDALDLLDILPPSLAELRAAIAETIQDFGLRWQSGDKAHVDQGESTTLLDQATNRLCALADSQKPSPAAVRAVIVELAAFFAASGIFDAVAQLVEHFGQARLRLFGLCEDSDGDVDAWTDSGDEEEC